MYINMNIYDVAVGSMSDKSKTWERIKEILSFFHSLYFLFLILGLIISVIPQIAPVFFNPLAVEIAKYATVVLISFLGSYFLFRKMERKMEKSKMTPLGQKIDTVTQKTEKEMEEYKKKTDQNLAELGNRIGELKDFKIKQEQEHIFINGKFSWIYGVQCPVCKRWIDLNLPNTIISGVHGVDGQPSNSTMRGTSEMSVQCPQCRNQFHIDIPHSSLFKAKPN